MSSVACPVIIIIYFLNVHSFHAQLRPDVFPDMRLLHISPNTTHSECKPWMGSVSSFTHSLQVSRPYPHISPLPPPHFYRLTPNHLHSYVPHAHTTSIYDASSPQPRFAHPEDYKNPHCATYPSATSRTSISPSSFPSSPDFAGLLSSSLRFQSHMSIHSEHKPCISFPSCGMVHPELSG